MVDQGIQPAEGLCRGASGAPVVIDSEDGQQLVGIVSRGPRDCQGPVTVVALAPTGKGFLHPGLAGRPPFAPGTDSNRCGACQASLALEDGPCLTVMGRCENEPACAAVRSAIAEQVTPAEIEATPTARTRSLWNCLCKTDCQRACKPYCARFAPWRSR